MSLLGSLANRNVSQDENSRASERIGKAATTKRAGSALGDITNRAPQQTINTTCNPPVPVFQQTFIDEDDMMVDEPTMEVEEIPHENIDEHEHDDPQAVTTYVEEIYENNRLREVNLSVLYNYMVHQAEISERMRGILIDWLVEVHLKFKLLPETMSLAVNLLDRFLSQNSVTRDNLQLVGITCMFLASKYEEIYPPECNDFVYISAAAYTRDQILTMEQTILNAVQFNLTVPTSLHFLRRFSKAARSDYPTHTLCKYLLELAMVDMRMIKYVPSKIAAASVYLARIMNHGTPDWNSTLHYYTKYDEETVRECALDLCVVLREAPTSNLQAVYRKYSSRKFGEVALKPAPQRI